MRAPAKRVTPRTWPLAKLGTTGWRDMAAQPSPPIGDALNAGFRYLEIKCAGCTMHSTVDLTTLRRPQETPIWQLERRMRCRQCSEMRGYPYKRGHLVRLCRTNITTREGEAWYPANERDRH
jgi:hypothetical protein